MKHKLSKSYFNTFYLLFFSFGLLAHSAMSQNLKGTVAYCQQLAGKSQLLPQKSNLSGSPLLGRSVALSTTIYNTDFTSAGVGAIRNIGTGTITLAGVSGTVTKAYLYWHGVTNSTTDVGGTILVNATPVTGASLGVSSDNCWGFNNSQAYRADVTSLVQLTGNGLYNLSGFGNGNGNLNGNGASLIVFFNDGDNTNNRDVVIFEGNDSNIFFSGISGNPNAPADPAGWNVSLSGINYVMGTANIQMHVSDGQAAPDAALVLNSSVLVPAGPIFEGNTVPGVNNGPLGNGRLWDIRSFDVTAFLTPGPNTLNLTTSASGSDCIALIVALIDLPTGAAPPPLCQVEAKCKNATVTLVNGNATITANDVNNGSTSTCDVQSLTVSKTTFNCTNIGDNNVTLTITDVNGNTSSCNAVVKVEGEIPSCSITATPSNNVYTGGVPTNLYIGYGPQSVTLNPNAAGGAPFTYSWTGPAGLNCTNCPNPVFTATTPGTFVYTVLVKNSYGCTTTCSVTITVIDIRCGKKLDKVSVCQVPPGNPGNAHTICISANGVPDHLANGSYLGNCTNGNRPAPGMIVMEEVQGTRVLPNPSHGQFSLQIPALRSDAEIVIINSIGVTIERRRVKAAINGQTERFDISKNVAGMYFIRITSGEKVETLKVELKR